MIKLANNDMVNFYKDYFVIGMLQGLADFANHNTLGYFLEGADKETKEFFKTTEFNEHNVSEEVIKFFSDIANELKPIWSEGKDTFDNVNGFDFWNDLYFGENSRSTLSNDEETLYEKYRNDFEDRSVMIAKTEIDGDIEYRLVFE